MSEENTMFSYSKVDDIDIEVNKTIELIKRLTNKDNKSFYFASIFFDIGVTDKNVKQIFFSNIANLNKEQKEILKKFFNENLNREIDEKC